MGNSPIAFRKFPTASRTFPTTSDSFPTGDWGEVENGREGLGRGETTSVQVSGGSRLRMRDGTTTTHRVSCNKCLYSNKSKQHPRENDLQTSWCVNRNTKPLGERCCGTWGHENAIPVTFCRTSRHYYVFDILIQ